MAKKEYIRPEVIPSPWGKQSGPLREEHAFAEGSLPVNSIPFLNRLKEILEEYKTNSLKSLPPGSEYHLKARALLWVLNSQVFGQLAEIDMSKEWDELDRAHKEGKF